MMLAALRNSCHGVLLLDHNGLSSLILYINLLLGRGSMNKLMLSRMLLLKLWMVILMYHMASLNTTTGIAVNNLCLSGCMCVCVVLILIVVLGHKYLLRLL
jgi:hypothetical protein